MIFSYIISDAKTSIHASEDEYGEQLTGITGIPVQTTIDKDNKLENFTKHSPDTTQNQTIPIVFSVDDQYALYLAVTIQSIVENSSEENFYLLRFLLLWSY